MTKDNALYKKFGANLKRYRRRRDLSLRDLFVQCGIDNGTLCRMENGQVNITLKTLSKLANALEIPSWELLIGIDD